MKGRYWKLLKESVEAYTASWIEIVKRQKLKNGNMSRLIQPRGLKYLFLLFRDGQTGRGLYSLVD